MKKLLIIYGKNRNFGGVDFMDYSLIEKSNSENLLIKGYDLMYMGETKTETKKIFENRLETQKNKLEAAGFNYWDTIYKLKYTK